MSPKDSQHSRGFCFPPSHPHSHTHKLTLALCAFAAGGQDSDSLGGRVSHEHRGGQEVRALVSSLSDSVGRCRCWALLSYAAEANAGI